MFGTARWRLTIWFAGAIALLLVVIGGAVYLSTRAVLFDQVNSDLQSRASQEQRLLRPRLPEPGGGGHFRDVVIGPSFTAGGYFYALVSTDGDVLASTANVDPSGLAGEETLAKAVADGKAFSDTTSSEDESLRVYVVRLEGRGGEELLMQVGRSTEPERQALRRLLVVLAGALGAGLVLAGAGGYLLAGRALRPIRSAMDAQRAFVGDASHELRTPLAVIRANAELMKRHAAEPVRANESAVDDIISESDRLGRIVAQMLTLAQVDAGQATLSMQEIPLDELTDEVARGMKLLAAERGVDLETEIERPLAVRGDRDRLRDLMVLLTDNAIKYTGSGGRVRLEVKRGHGDSPVIRVSDTGPGIPPEALPHVFDRFYRVDKARSREAGGTGLGLAIAKWIAEAHGGSIDVESSVGAGSSFTVELPA